MKPLYLGRVLIQEFRSFAKLDVGMPAAPGVLIVHGSNGLGKSSLFDGLEWTLTDRIDHFREARKAPEKHYLRRWDAARDKQTEICLEFSGSSKISRSLTSGLDPKGVTNVAEFLRAPNWNKKIEHLNRYLLLTHFLGQSTVSRMTHRGAKERWEFLQEPAQSDRATAIVKALHGHGASTAARAFERRAAELGRQATELERLLQREELQWQEAQLEGAIDDGAARAEASVLHAVLVDIQVGLGRTPVPEPRLTLDTMIDTLVKLHDEAAHASLQRELALNRGRDLVSERQRMEVDLAAASAALDTTQRQAEAVLPLLEEARSRRAAQRQAVDAAVEHYRVEQTSLRALTHFLRALDTLTTLRGAINSARDLRDEAVALLGAAEAKVRKADRRRALAERLAARLTEAHADAVQLAARMELIAVAERTIRARDAAAAHLEQLAQGNANLETDIQSAHAAWQSAAVHAEGVATDLHATQRSVNELSAAVAAIAVHLPEQACECPVCETSFGTAQELRDRIGRAVERLAPAVATLEARLVAAKRERDDAEVRHTGLLSTATELESRREQAERTATVVHDNLTMLGDVEPLPERDLAVLREQVQAAIDRVAYRRRRTERWFRHPIVGGADGALAAWTQATRARTELVLVIETRRVNVARIEAELNEAESALVERASAAKLSVDASNDVIVAARAERAAREAEAERAVAVAREHVRSSDEALASIEASEAQIGARVAELAAQRAALISRVEQLEHDWRVLKLSKGPIAAEALQDSARDLPALHAALEAANLRVQRLRAGRVAWMRLDRHRATLEELRLALDAAPVTEREGLRRAGLERQSNLLRRSTAVLSAKAIAHSAGGEVTRRVEAFNQTFLAPMSELMNRINRTILSEPEIGVDLRIGTGKVEQHARAIPGGPSFMGRLDPQLVHSEGQMAALAVSMLCAASLTFPWSRWRALIMDDPLQHNDVVHAAAFADMLRNLILACGYQVFLSTHDMAQAEFLRRKFSAADIPCTMVHLLGRGRGGVEFQTSYSGPKVDVHQTMAQA